MAAGDADAVVVSAILLLSLFHVNQTAQLIFKENLLELFFLKTASSVSLPGNLSKLLWKSKLLENETKQNKATVWRSVFRVKDHP